MIVNGRHSIALPYQLVLYSCRTYFVPHQCHLQRSCPVTICENTLPRLTFSIKTTTEQTPLWVQAFAFDILVFPKDFFVAPKDPIIKQRWRASPSRWEYQSMIHARSLVRFSTTVHWQWCQPMIQNIRLNILPPSACCLRQCSLNSHNLRFSTTENWLAACFKRIICLIYGLTFGKS